MITERPMSGKKRTLLFVENDKNIALFYTGIFGGEYKVRTTITGSEAVSIVKHTEEIDLVILDYRLDDMSGLDVLKEIKDCRPAVPVILVTAYGDEDVAVKAFRYGAKDYIKKPFVCKELIGRIELCLSLKRADKSSRRSVCLDEHHYSVKKPLKDIAGRHHLNIQKALQFIDDNFMVRIDLAAAAEQARLSRYHFCRVFQKTTGMSFQEYVTERRMQKAKELLKDSGRTITEIAHFVGYSDPNNLIRNFKKRTGLTPSEFRDIPDLTHARPESPE
jgi:YesN/AraC family two-component response regulator